MSSTNELLLRLWVLTTGLASLGASVGAYLKPLSPHLTLYRRTKETASASFSRMYATWLLSSTCIRFAFFLAPDRSPSTPVFWLTFATYILALWHFVLEIVIFKTVSLRPGGMAPLMVAGGSIIWFGVIIVGIL